MARFKVIPMTEIEKLQYTKEFIDKLANGINPLDGVPIPEGDLMNEVRLSRCMFYVSDILRQVIENGGVGRRKREKTTKTPFSLTPEQLSLYRFEARPISMSEFAKKLYDLAEDSQMEKPTYKRITAWLLSVGILAEETDASGHIRKYPTEEGVQLGITRETRKGRQGDYEVVTYNREAQQFMLDNLEAILSDEA